MQEETNSEYGDMTCREPRPVCEQALTIVWVRLCDGN